MPVTHISNSVWSVGDEYILKSGSREWISRSVILMKALAAHGADVGEPIPTKAGEDYCLCREDDRVWALYSAVKGAPLAVSERFGNNRREYAFKYGEAIAKLHKALARIEAPADITDIDLFRHITEWAIPRANVSNELISEYTGNFETLCGELPRQLIHRDTHPENIMWNDGKISGFIDFDIAQINTRIWDVLYCSTALLSDCPREDHGKWFDVLHGLLSGYNSVSPLTEAERKSVYYVIISIHLVFIAWSGEEIQKSQIREMLGFIVENKERIFSVSDL